MIIIQKAAIKQGDKFLLLLRSALEDPMSLHWDFPGGRLEDGEDLVEGIKREVREETTLEIDNCQLDGEYIIDIYNKPHPFKVYKVDLLSDPQNLKLSIEHDDYRWATKEEIVKLEKINYFLKYYLNIIPYQK